VEASPDRPSRDELPLIVPAKPAIEKSMTGDF